MASGAVGNSPLTVFWCFFFSGFHFILFYLNLLDNSPVRPYSPVSLLSNVFLRKSPSVTDRGLLGCTTTPAGQEGTMFGQQTNAQATIYALQVPGKTQIIPSFGCSLYVSRFLFLKI
jgi:hypothetical protein